MTYLVLVLALYPNPPPSVSPQHSSYARRYAHLRLLASSHGYTRPSKHSSPYPAASDSPLEASSLVVRFIQSLRARSRGSQQRDVRGGGKGGSERRSRAPSPPCNLPFAQPHGSPLLRCLSSCFGSVCILGETRPYQALSLTCHLCPSSCTATPSITPRFFQVPDLPSRLCYISRFSASPCPVAVHLLHDIVPPLPSVPCLPYSLVSVFLRAHALCPSAHHAL